MARWKGRDRSDGGGFSDALRRVANADNPLGMSLPLVLRVQNDHFPAAMMVYLHGGRQD